MNSVKCPFCDEQVIVICAKCRNVQKLPSTVAAWRLVADLRATQHGHSVPAAQPVQAARNVDLSGAAGPACPRCQQTLLLVCPKCLRARLVNRTVCDLSQGFHGDKLGVSLDQCFSSDGKDPSGVWCQT
jgi:predicted RNA-binding Zn-ribbon protein involved in translation (DUF1610 family)